MKANVLEAVFWQNKVLFSKHCLKIKKLYLYLFANLLKILRV